MFGDEWKSSGAGESPAAQPEFYDKLDFIKRKYFKSESHEDGASASDGSIISVTQDDMDSDCDSMDGMLQIDESADQSREEEIKEEVIKPEVETVNDKNCEFVKSSASALPKVPGSSMARLESLVHNLMQSKTQQKIPSPESQRHEGLISPIKPEPISPLSAQSEPETTEEKIVKKPKSQVSSPEQKLPSPGVQAPFMPAMPLLGLAPQTMPAFPGMPGYPFMTPFGMPSMMSMPQENASEPIKPIASRPSQQTLAPPSAHNAHQSPSPGTSTGSYKLSPSFSPPASDAPLDLSLSTRKRKLNLDQEPEKPLNLTKPTAMFPSPGQGLLQIHIPQSIKPASVPASNVVSSPKPGVLVRHGSSAFTAVASPAAKPICSTVTPKAELSPSTPPQVTPPKTGYITPPNNGKPQLTPPFCSPEGNTSTPVNLRIKEMCIYEHNVLQAEFLEAAKKPKSGHVIRRLQQNYRQETERIEIERHQAISNSSDDLQKTTVQTVFDNQRLLLAKQFKAQLSQEKAQLDLLDGKNVDSLPPPPPAAPQGAFPGLPMMPMPGFGMSGSMFPTPQGLPFPMMPMMPHMIPQGMKLPTMPMTASMSSQSSSQASSPPQDTQNGGSQSPNSSLESNSAGEQNISPKLDGKDSPRGNKRRFLSQHSVSVLSEWYEGHFDHPYPDDNDVSNLAMQAGITPSQVKKWMANKRVRSCNTLAFNGSIHPKKLQKLIQLKESSSPSSQSAAQVQQEIISSMTPRTPPSDKKSSKRLLNPNAVNYMTNWYSEHINYPYPTEAEKAVISAATGLSISQVTCWFANKRNRSNNTRKISTKVMWQKLNRKMQIYDSMSKKTDGSSVPVSMVPMPQMEFPMPNMEYPMAK